MGNITLVKAVAEFTIFKESFKVRKIFEKVFYS